MKTNDFAKLSTEELQAEEKKLKRNEIVSAGLIGLAVGIIIYGIAKQGFGFLFIALAAGLIYVVYQNSKKTKERLKTIKEVLENRK